MAQRRLGFQGQCGNKRPPSAAVLPSPQPRTAANDRVSLVSCRRLAAGLLFRPASWDDSHANGGDSVAICGRRHSIRSGGTPGFMVRLFELPTRRFRPCCSMRHAGWKMSRMRLDAGSVTNDESRDGEQNGKRHSHQDCLRQGARVRRQIVAAREQVGIHVMILASHRRGG